MQEFQTLLSPVILFLLMVVVGLQLVVDDFRRVLSAPRAVISGTLGQLLLLPLMTWGVVAVLDVPPLFAAGAVLLAATPGAAMSNVMTAVARANVALSVTLTAVASILAVVTLPLLAAVGIATFVDDSFDIDVPILPMVSQLVMFVGAPIGVGMLVRARKPEAAQRYVSRANRFAAFGVLVLTGMGILSGVISGDTTSAFPSAADFGLSLLAATVWTLLAMAIGWGVATLVRLEGDDRFTFVVEFSARNLALTIILAMASFGRLDLGLFAVAYSMSGFPLVIVVAILRGRLSASEKEEPPGGAPTSA